MNFLKQIDRHRSNKYFFVPDLDSTFQYLLGGDAIVTAEAVVKYLGDMAVQRIVTERGAVPISSYVIHRIRTVQTFALQVLDSRAFNNLFTTGWSSGFVADQKSIQRSYLQIAKDKGDADSNAFVESIRLAIISLQNEQKETAQAVVEGESTSGLIKLDGV